MISLIQKTTVVLIVLACGLRVPGMADPELTGKLITLDNKSIVVNDQKVKTGATITTGSDIRLPDKIGATIDLGQLGRIDIAPKSDLRLGFDKTGIIIHLRVGYLVLTTTKGVRGVVTTAEKKLFSTDSSRGSSIEVKTKDALESGLVGARQITK